MTKKAVRITELVLRDGHQSILATRMRTEDMLPICEQIDRVGYWSVEMWGGATFDACLRFLGEDPWDRLRLIKETMPNTPLQMLLRGQNLVGYRHYSDAVVERFVDKAIEYGINVFRIFDALNDVRNLETAVRRALKGGAHAQGTICYTVSPVHTVEKFVAMSRKLEDMGCQSLVVKDMAALMLPYPAAELVAALKAAVKIPVHVHTHATTGVAAMVLLKAIEFGADGVDTSISAISGGPGHVPTESLVAAIQGTPYDSGLDQKKLAAITAYFKAVRPKYKEHESSFVSADTRMFVNQIPGGMISNLESQLKEMGCFNRIDEVLSEVPRVRREMGYIPLVTPTSQIVGAQATLNVLMGRYKNVTTEARAIFAGRYGETPAPMDAEIQKKVLKGEQPITCRPADLLEDDWDKLASEVEGKARSEADVLSYAIFPKVWLEYYANCIKEQEPADQSK